MADMSVELHALKEELISFVECVAPEFRLFVSVIRFPPFEIEMIDISDLRKATADPRASRLALTTSQLALPEEMPPRPLQTRFWEHNPNRMIIHLGKITNRGLQESRLTARTYDPLILDTWRQIVLKLRSQTKTGAFAVNPETGVSSKLKTHRFTKGALELQEQGVAMLPLVGNAIVRLGG